MTTATADRLTDTPDGGILFSRSIYEEREAFHMLMDIIDAEMAGPGEELSREATATVRSVIGRRRRCSRVCWPKVRATGRLAWLRAPAMPCGSKRTGP
jgi:hypothetical protein